MSIKEKRRKNYVVYSISRLNCDRKSQFTWNKDREPLTPNF